MPTKPVAEPDLTLLRRFAEEGDAEAFARIVRRHAGTVYAACHRVLRDSGRAEDVSQETFFRLWKQPHLVTQSLAGWLHRAATRLALDALRSETSRRRRETTAGRDAAVNGAARGPGRDVGPSKWEEVSPRVDEALAALPEGPRELLVRHFLQGTPQNDLAAEVKTSPATMSRRIKSAVEALREELLKKGVSITPALLAGLFARHAAEAAPASLVSELGKIVMLGHPSAAAAAAAGSATATGAGGAAAAGWGWGASVLREIRSALRAGAGKVPKEQVSVWAAVALGLFVSVPFYGSWWSYRSRTPGPREAEPPAEFRDTAGGQPAASPPATRWDQRPGYVRVVGPRSLDAGKVREFGWNGTDGSIDVVFGDGRSVHMPREHARPLIEAQAGKTLEQLMERPARDSP